MPPAHAVPASEVARPFRLEAWRDVPRAGLGCSKLGSIMGADHARSAQVIRAALDCGIRYFDTADIYAQGDSEQILAKTLRADGGQDWLIATKIGQKFNAGYRSVRQLKSIARRIAGYSPRFRERLAARRQAPLAKDFSPAYLRQALGASLARLGAATIDIVYLHSPDEAVIKAGGAIGVLCEAQDAGKIGLVGISCDTTAAAAVALDDARVDVIQLPFDESQEFEAVLRRARSAGVAVVVRGVMQAYLGSGERDLPAFLSRVLADPAITIALAGTTNPENIRSFSAATR